MKPTAIHKRGRVPSASKDTAWTDGQRAGLDGQPQSANPYPLAGNYVGHHCRWREGWRVGDEARREDEAANAFTQGPQT